MTNAIDCELEAHSNSPHLQQLYTGFAILQKQGLLRLSFKIVKKQVFDNNTSLFLRDKAHSHLSVILNKSIRVFYDMHDSFEISDQDLKKCDYYFKRSYLEDHVRTKKEYQKIRPYGLNYLVYPNFFDKHAVLRSGMNSNLNKKIKTALRAFHYFDFLHFVPREKRVQEAPIKRDMPKILFMVGAWDPHDDVYRSSKKIEERVEINEMRAECISLMRKEFKSLFYGGFMHSNFSRKHFKDLLLPDSTVSKKKNYLNLVRNSDICISSTGLHGSIGWKFAEYIAFSKAIVCEKLKYNPDSALKKNQNYLEFQTARQCVDNVTRLVNNSDLRNKMCYNNQDYYHRYLKPDKIIFNTISTVLQN